MDTSKVLDFSAAMDRVDNDMDLYFELIAMLDEDRAQALERIRTAITSGACDAVESESHALKSALGNLGAMKAYGLSYELETLGRNQNLTDAAATLDALQDSIEEFRKAVEEKR